MSQTIAPACPDTSPEETERWNEEYRQLGFAHRAPAHVVYSAQHVPCPWEGCDNQIKAIGFHLEKMGDHALHEKLLETWWRGLGLIGRCPSCGRYVLFALTEKRPVADLTMATAVLPDNWFQIADVIPEQPTATALAGP